jgi:hypothetical protein
MSRDTLTSKPGSGDAVLSAPDKVFYSMQIVVVKIDEPNSSITFDVVCHFVWAPASVTFDDDSSPQFSRVDESSLPWVPQVIFFNMKEKTETEMSYFMDPSTGCTGCTMNWVIDCYETFELNQFPFDRQLAKVTFYIHGCNLVPMRPVADGGVPCPESFPSLDDQTQCHVSLGNWDLNSIEGFLERRSDKDVIDSEVHCIIELSRIPWFYLWNIVLVIFVLVLASFCVLGVPIDDLADRMSITMTISLTIVAFKFVITGMVPPTPYLTFLDKYVLFSFVLIGIEVVENFIASYATDSNSLRFENVFYSILVVVWLSIHAILVVGTHYQWFYQSWDKVHKLDDETSQTASQDYKAINIEGEDDDDDSEEEDGNSGATNKDGIEVNQSDGENEHHSIEMGSAL